MMQVTVDVVTILLLLCVSGAALIFYLRLTKLREAISEAGEVLPKLDMAVERMNEAATGFSGRIQTEIQAVDIRIANVKRLVSDMENRVRDADELASKLETQLRQARKLDQARNKAVPRELAEPKGFAERVEQLAAAALPEKLPEALPEATMQAAVSLLPDSMPDEFHALSEIPALVHVPTPPSKPPVVEAVAETKEPEDMIMESPERVSLMSMAPFNSFATGRAE